MKTCTFICDEYFCLEEEIQVTAAAVMILLKLGVQHFFQFCCYA